MYVAAQGVLWLQSLLEQYVKDYLAHSSVHAQEVAGSVLW